MKKTTYLTLLVTMLIAPVFSGCEKEDLPVDNDPTESNFVVYTNESGVPNEEANVLQAVYTDELTGDAIDFYGNFDAEGSPLQVQTVRVKQADSDTIINFIINPITNNFDKAILEVNGSRLAIMVSFFFPEGDTSMVMSYYDVNWNTGESELIYSSELLMTNGSITERPIFYQPRLASPHDGGAFAGLLAGVGTGIAVAETVAAIGGGFSLAGTAAGAVAAGVAAVGTSVILGVVVVGATLIAITNNANASEPVPSGTPLPPGTPQSNPTPDPEPQIPTPVNPCLTNGVNVTVGVDPGNVLVAIATGGTGGPYTFSWSTGATATAGTYTTLTPGQPGTYSVSVVDANGCAASGSATIGEGVGECQLCATASGTQFSWSNGSTSSCITVNEPGTYTVTVSDTLLPQPINEQFQVLGVTGALECP
ncbi:MAG: hypothetical protein H6603_00390 [Flavobacteriales bacterium]|nr:hypothetical protein [Flavobacteriales bacterium]MCB9203406.1 hypothetical protein [Flavobacteriales bacterium]